MHHQRRGVQSMRKDGTTPGNRTGIGLSQNQIRDADERFSVAIKTLASAIEECAGSDI